MSKRTENFMSKVLVGIVIFGHQLRRLKSKSGFDTTVIFTLTQSLFDKYKELYDTITFCHGIWG